MEQSADRQPNLIIFDSNIIQYTAHQKSANAFKKYIAELITRGFTFAISNITVYELLKGATQRTEAKMVSLLDEFYKFEIDESVLQYAAKLESVYKLEDIYPNEIEDGDKIIVVTALLSSGIILAANAMDFPVPFFKEVERQFITFEYGRERTRTIVVYLLQPQLDITEKRIAEVPQ